MKNDNPYGGVLVDQQMPIDLQNGSGLQNGSELHQPSDRKVPGDHQDPEGHQGDLDVSIVGNDFSPVLAFWRTIALASAGIALWHICKTYSVLSLWQFDSESTVMAQYPRVFRPVAYAGAEFALAGILSIIATLMAFFGAGYEKMSLGFLFIRMTFLSWVMLLLCYLFVRV